MPELGAAGAVSVLSTWLLTYVLHSTVVVGAVWVLVRTGRVRRPTTQDLLWKVALVAALATASVAVLGPARLGSRALTVDVRSAARDGGVAWESALPPGQDVQRVRIRAVEPSPACREALAGVPTAPSRGLAAVRRACGARSGIGWRGLLVAVWLLGAGGLLLRALVVRREVRGALRGAYPAPDDIRAAARRLSPPGRRPVEVVVSPSMDAPCVVGGRVVLPVRCALDLTPDQIQAVVAHEVAHLLRRDPAWISVGDLVCRALWMQPLNRLALRGLRESAELVCDDWAVDRTRRPMELASSIARVAEWIHPGRRMPAPALAHLAQLARGPGRVLSTRVRRVLTPGASRRAAPRLHRLLLATLVVAPTFALPAVPRGATVFAVFVRQGTAAQGSPAFLEMRTEDVVVMVRETARTDS